jgi:hypothetical protein
LPEGRPFSGKARTLLKIELASIQIFGENKSSDVLVVPGFAGHPARLPKAGFVFFKSGKFLPSWADHIGPRQDKSDSLAPANGIFAVFANGLDGA